MAVKRVYFFDDDDINEDVQSENKSYSVHELNEYVREILDNHPELRSVIVEGEISGFKRYPSGHCYFSLKDSESKIECVMFKGSAVRLDFKPQDGMLVKVRARVDLYVASGRYQLSVTSMSRMGEGELYAKFIELKNKLAAEGLFDEAHKKPLPRLPRAVGVVTSESGAVKHDIISVIGRRFPKMNFVFCHCAVQGATAPKEIAAAIKTMDKRGKVDVIIFGRGGGSMEDLWCFNDERVARAVYDCKTPIISAVGHEVDFTISDFVADVRAATPSAAAELAVPVYSELIAELSGVERFMHREVEYAIESRENRLDDYEHRCGYEKAESLIADKLRAMDERREKLDKTTDTEIENCQARIKAYADKLESLSPMSVLKRGYAIIQNENGVIKSISELDGEKNVKITLSDGETNVKINPA